jgi:hypothetical protein
MNVVTPLNHYYYFGLRKIIPLLIVRLDFSGRHSIPFRRSGMSLMRCLPVRKLDLIETVFALF